jgi:hypothetical protein
MSNTIDDIGATFDQIVADLNIRSQATSHFVTLLVQDIADTAVSKLHQLDRLAYQNPELLDHRRQDNLEFVRRLSKGLQGGQRVFWDESVSPWLRGERPESSGAVPNPSTDSLTEDVDVAGWNQAEEQEGGRQRFDREVGGQNL